MENAIYPGKRREGEGGGAGGGGEGEKRGRRKRWRRKGRERRGEMGREEHKIFLFQSSVIVIKIGDF